ncbi:MAG: phenylacetate--CoA ligase family protein [Planctomycetaceae bacterium]
MRSTPSCPLRAELDRLKLARLADLLDRVLPANAFYAAKLGGRRPPRSFDEFADWPLTTKAELVGGVVDGVPANLTFAPAAYVRYHQTSGTHGRPLPVFDTAADWEWWMECWRMVLERGAVGPGDRVLVASSFGPYLGFWSGFDGVVARGAMAIPTGGMSSLARLELARATRATVLVATPSYALHLAEVAAVAGIDTSALPIRLVVLAGEPGGSVPAVRAALGKAWSADVLDHAGASEVGPWGVGGAIDGRASSACGGDPWLEVIEEWFHPEFLPFAAGGSPELAELVLTTLGRIGAPVIRYRTGDVVRPRWPSADEMAAGAAPRVRLVGGILGRSDDMLLVRGVNIFPSAIEGILRAFPEVAEYRVTVETREHLGHLVIEVEDRLHAPVRIADALRLGLGLKIDVIDVQPGSLPRFEGKARRVVDRRTAPGALPTEASA